MQLVHESALQYLRSGFSVIPCKADDKKPYLKWQEFQTKKATEEEVISWWNKWPSAMAGIVTGSISGVSVIDIDEPAGREEIQKFIPDSLLMPTCQTPRNGQHLYFKSPDPPLGNNSRVIPGCDFRGEGGYVIAPPSKNSNGGVYTWMSSLSIAEVEPPPLPIAYINKIINSNTYMRSTSKNDYQTTETTKLFIEGRRDEDLFHIANLLVKGGANEIEVRQTLERLAFSCTPPFPLKELDAKIQSAFKRAQTREHNLAEEVRQWILSSSGVILSSEVGKCLQVSSREEQKNLSKVFSRLIEEGLIERHGERNGCFRIRENTAEEVNFLNAPTEDFPITWPLGVHNLCLIYPGNIVVIAGSKSSGKTAFLLNTVKLNQGQHEIIYLNSEMGDTEFRKRLELFEGVNLSSWNFKAFHRQSNFEDLITADRKIFIIDFLEVTTDFWKVAQYIQAIHRKLKEGVAIIALQKADAKDVGRGGDFSREKARLYISLDYLPEKKANRLKIIDAKAWRTSQNPRGLERFYKLANGSKFFPEGDWEG